MKRDVIRRAVRVFLKTSLALIVPGFLGWLNELTQWARGEGQTPFPDGRSLAYLGVVAIVAGVVAVVSMLWDVIEDGLGKGVLREVPPRPDPNRGAASLRWAWIGLAFAPVVAVILLL